MWFKTRVTELLHIQYPLIQAPMAGGVTTPKLVAAVSNSGGLGSLGAGYMSKEQMKEAVREIRSLTDKPFAVNLFIPEPESAPEIKDEMMAVLDGYRRELGLPPGIDASKFAEPFAEQLEAVLEEKVPVFSFTFGIPARETIRALKQQGITVIGTATTVREAVKLEESGVDLIVGQGSEAGGHRGTFLGPYQDALVGTMALIPQMVDHVQVPVIAAGGIMDGRGIAAARILGAEGVQMGSAFLACEESGAHEAYKNAILTSTDDSTVITKAFSGKAARGIKNRFIQEMAEKESILSPYPLQNALTKEIRQAAAKANRAEFMSLWAGQASAMAARKTAGQLVSDLVEQTTKFLGWSR